MKVPYKTFNRVAMWSSNLTLGHISGGSYNSKRHMHPNDHSGTIYNSRGMEATSMSTGRWMYKDVVPVHNGILLTHKK